MNRTGHQLGIDIGSVSVAMAEIDAEGKILKTAGVSHHGDIAGSFKTVTEAMTRRIELVTGIPVVSITYDGTGGVRNDAVIPYLKYPRRRSLPMTSGSSIAKDIEKCI